MIIIGNITLDDFILKDGRIFSSILGGPPSYSSHMLNSLFNIKPYIFTTLGKDFPAKYEKELNNVAKLYITTKESRTTKFRIIEKDTTRELFLLAYSGDINKVNYDLSDVYIISPVYKEIKKKHIIEAYKRGFVALDPQGLLRKVDSSGKVHLSFHSEIRYLLSKINIFRTSIDEYSVLSGGVSIPQYLKNIIKQGVELAVITSKDKIYYATPETYEELPSYTKVKARSSTGAGDVFTSILTYVYIKNYDPVKAVAYSAIAASFSVEKLGPSKIDSEKFKLRLKEYLNLIGY